MAANVRTPDELLREEFNYYIAFEIDLKEKDPKKLETIIKQENNKWSGGSVIFRRYKELFNDMLEVMVNDKGYNPSSGTYSVPGARDEEAKRAKEIKLKKAVELIVSLCKNKGRLYKSDVQNIVSNGKVQWFSVDELENAVSYLFKQGIKYIDDTQSLIDFKKYKRIRDFLKTLKKDNLYELVGLSKSSSVAEILAAVDTVYKGIKNRTSPEGTATDKLCGLAKDVFKDDTNKKKYDDYLALRDTVWEEMRLRQQHGIKEISMEDFLSYAETIRSTLNIGIEEVESIIAAGLTEFKLIVVASEGETAKDSSGEEIDLEICPYPDCAKAYRVSKKAPPKSCPHCGKPFEIVCWNCGKGMAYTTKSKSCASCGATFQSKQTFDKRIAEMEAALGNISAEIIDLKTALANLKNVITDYAKDKNSVAYKRISQYESIIAKKEADEATLGVNYRADVDKINQEVALKKYQTAQGLALSLRNKYPLYNRPTTDKLIADIAAVIAKAQAQVQTAKSYAAANNVEMAISAATKALEIVKDHNEAIQILKKYPPEAPTNVRTSVLPGGGVRVEWDRKSSQSGVTYTVIKKIGSKPTSKDDGNVLDTALTISFYEDKNIVSATPYYYAVYAERAGVLSSVVVTPQPLLVFRDVSGIRQEMVDGPIKVKWDTPYNVKSVEVYKKAGPIAPMSPSDGAKVSAVTNEGFEDKDSAPECSYLIICKYDVAGSIRTSKGVTATFKKFEIIEPLKDVKIIPNITGDFTMKANFPGKGKVKVFCTTEKMPCKYSNVYRMSEFASMFKNVRYAQAAEVSDGEWNFVLPANEVVWVYPMVCNDQLFAVEQPVLLNTLDCASGLSFTTVAGGVKVSCNPSSSVKRILFMVSDKEFCKLPDGKGEKYFYTRDQFANGASAVIKLKADTLSYITMFGEIERNGVISYTRGLPLGDEPVGNLRKVQVQFALEYKPVLGKPYVVTVKFAADEAVTVPSLVLVKGTPKPMEKSAGELVEKTSPIELKKGMFGKRFTGKLQVKVPPDSIKIKYSLFLANESDNRVRLKEVISL